MPCTKRAARHTIVLISLRRGQHHGDCRRAVTHELLYSIFAAPCKCNPPEVDGSARFGLTAAPQAKCECFRLHDCIVGRSLHARLQRLCSTAGRQVAGTRCHVAGLLCRTCSQAMARRSSSTSLTHARAAVKFPYVVTALPISKLDTLHCIVLYLFA